MAEKMTLVLGSHAHVPYGADTSEFEKAYTNQLRPFISSLNKYPKIQAALHYSGVLLHWVERSHPELFMLIEDMVTRKQVEMLGGGFYEPMLPIIPLQDKIGQIEQLTTYLRKQFGKRPQGCWIPAFAWEQSLVSPLAACGMGFTFLSERQFALAGVKHADAPCICEDQGKLITVFPVLGSLETALAVPSAEDSPARGSPPAKSISALLSALLKDYHKRRPQKTELVVSIFPQKINVGQNESMDCAWGRFFDDLSSGKDFIETMTPGKLYKGLNDLQKLYFPDSSDAADNTPSRRFIIAHPEAGGIYAKMVFTNVLINQLRGDKSRKLSAREEMWKAQGSALFSATGAQGLHNHLLRNAAYSALLGAEQITREKTKFTPSLVPFDFNMNGTDEWLFQDTRINCYVQSIGGGVFELDYLPKAWNYLDTCNGRQAFADRLLPPRTEGSAFKLETLKYGDIEGARLCRSEHYKPVDIDKVRRKLRLVLAAELPVLQPKFSAENASSLEKMPPSFACIEIEKVYSLKKDSICVGYLLTNSGAQKETFQFAPEIDLALPGEGNAFTRFFTGKSGQADAALVQPMLHGAEGLKIHDIKNEVQIMLTVTQPFDGKVLPIFTPDYETDAVLYQAFCIMPLFPVSLEAGEKWEIEFTLKFSH